MKEMGATVRSIDGLAGAAHIVTRISSLFQRIIAESWPLVMGGND